MGQSETSLIVVQIKREAERFDRYDPDPYMFERLLEVAEGRCTAPCEGGYFPCDKCGRPELWSGRL